LTVAAATDKGDQREVLVALRHRLAQALDDATNSRDVAALAKRLQEVTADIAAIDAATMPYDGEPADDEAFNPDDL
jgi:hypothetical protein